MLVALAVGLENVDRIGVQSGMVQCCRLHSLAEVNAQTIDSPDWASNGRLRRDQIPEIRQT